MRATHRPTGATVEWRAERGRKGNTDAALAFLAAKVERLRAIPNTAWETVFDERGDVDWHGPTRHHVVA